MANQHTDALFNIVMGDKCLLKTKKEAFDNQKIVADCIDRERSLRGQDNQIEEYEWTFEIPVDVRSEYDFRGELLHVQIRHFHHMDSTHYRPAKVIDSDDMTDVKDTVYIKSLEIVDE